MEEINRLFIIGNGFDLANGMLTSYKNFIDSYWNGVVLEIHGKCCLANFSDFEFNDNFCHFNFSWSQKEKLIEKIGKNFNHTPKNNTPFDFNFYKEIIKVNSDLLYYESAKIPKASDYFVTNNFLFEISSFLSIKNWVDVEAHYYKLLSEILEKPASKNFAKSESLQKLNKEFEQVKLLLINYLEDLPRRKINGEFAYKMEQIFINKELPKVELPNSLTSKSEEEKLTIKNYKILNFNFTNTIENYDFKIDKNNINYIHGNISNQEKNPIIFGFGDEISESYINLENTGDNEYLEHIKSFQYLGTDNYKNLLDFIDSENFQVYLMGHSCGLSDRVLLNTIFEHENCLSIKIFYYQKQEWDDFKNITMNISRHFKNKARMRAVVVNKKYCQPLPQLNSI